MSSDSVESKNVKELLKILKDLKKKGVKFVVKICPVCKGPQIQFMKARFDIVGAMGIARPKFLCKKCGYLGEVALELTVDEIDDKTLTKFICEAMNLQKHLMKHALKEKPPYPQLYKSSKHSSNQQHTLKFLIF